MLERKGWVHFNSLKDLKNHLKSVPYRKGTIAIRGLVLTENQQKALPAEQKKPKAFDDIMMCQARFKITIQKKKTGLGSVFTQYTPVDQPVKQAKPLVSKKPSVVIDLIKVCDPVK